MKKIKSLVLLSLISGVFLSVGLLNSKISTAKGESEIEYLNENYVSTSIASSKCYSYSHVANGVGSSHALIPGEKWGDPITAANGNVVYKINANDGMAFSTLKLDLTYLARTDLSMSDGSPTSEAAIKVYYSNEPTSFDEPIEILGGWKSSSALKTSTIDLSTYAEGASTSYIMVELCHNAGKVSLANTGTKLNTARFYGEEKESSICYVSKEDSYISTSSANCKFDSFYQLGGFSNSNGLVPTNKWGADVDCATTGYVIYSLSTPVGPTFTSLSVSFSGRAWSGGTGTSPSGQQMTTAGCNFKLYISNDVTNFGTPVKTFAAVGSGSTANFNYSDSEICKNNTTIYVKIELNHPEMKCSLSQVGVRLYTASISGGYDKSELIESTPMNDTIIFNDIYKDCESTGVLTPFTSDGRTYVYSGGDKASIIIPISCNPLYKFYNLTYSQLIRCTTYNGAEGIENALKFYVSIDGVNFELVSSIDTDTNWTRKSAVINLSSYVRGYHNAFIKVEYNWYGKAYSHDWIALSDITLTGDLLDRTTFDIFYENMDGAINGEGNPLTYNYGSSVTLADPSKANYTFAGWYLDSEFNNPFNGITSVTKGDVTVYAKWEAIYIPITLDANGGEFSNHAGTYIAQGHYELPLSRTGLPIPTSTSGSFINWFKDINLTTPFNFAEDYGDSDIITSSITLYAKYGNSVKVTYQYNNGNTDDVIFYQEANQKANVVAEPTYDGYKFGGWYLGETKYDFNTPLTIDITLVAHWYHINYVTYTGLENGTHSNVSSYTADQNNITLSDASRPGYSFAGWFMDGAQVTFIDTSLEKDITLEARWEAISYNLTVQCDEHSSINNAPSSLTFEGVTLKIDVDQGYRIKRVTANNNVVFVNEDKTVLVSGFSSDVTIIVETAPSYYFNGSINIDFKDETDFTKRVADCNNVKPYTGDSSSSRYGWLVPEDYSKPGFITYAIDAGKNQTINSLALTGTGRVFTYQNSKARLDLYFSLDGSNFELINSYKATTNGDTNTDISVNLTPKAKGQQIIYIKYVLESGNYDWVCLDSIHASMSFTCVTVKFMDGNTVMYTNTDQIKGAPVTLLENPSKPGYSFLGWYSDSNFRHKVDASTVVTEDMNIYAKWEANTYNINYVVGEGADIGDNVESYTIEDEIELSEAYKKNYKFVGWYDNSSFNGETISTIKKGTYGDLTLYAKFEAGVRITYVLDGGENNELNPEVYFIDDTMELFDPYREGYVFGGWYLDPGFNDLVDCLEGLDGEPVTLYAMWIKDGDGDQDSNGCGGSIVATSLSLSIFSVLGLALIGIKKKEK